MKERSERRALPLGSLFNHHENSKADFVCGYLSQQQEDDVIWQRMFFRQAPPPV